VGAETERAERLLDLTRQAKEATAVKAPPELDFIQSLRIEDKVSGALVPFALWDFQREMVESGTLDSPRLFALKSRQLGWTWLDLAHWLFCAEFAGHRTFAICRQTQDDAADAIRRLKIMHESAVASGKWVLPAVTQDNVLSLGFANGSLFHALPATKRMGRGGSYYGALLDEFCFWDYQSDQLAALEPGCARIHVVTTGDGPGDFAHKLWKQALAGEGDWRAVFAGWQAHPGRTQAWYDREVLGAVEPRKARREYAATPDDAFAAPEGVFFERFDSLRNVAKADDALPVLNWQTERAVDFGYRNPACLWIQTSPQGQPFVVGELVPENLTTEQFVAAIRATEAGLGIHAGRLLTTYCDPAGRGVQSQTSETEFDIFARSGLGPVCKPSGIRDGCLRIMSHLADPVLPLVVSRDCPWLIEALSSVKPDKHRPDLYDEQSEYTHALDALRYWAVNHVTAVDYGHDEPEPAYDPFAPPGMELPVAAGIYGRVW
jgi:hypothetical protein